MTPKQSVSQPSSEPVAWLWRQGAELQLSVCGLRPPPINAFPVYAEPAVHLPDLGIAQGHVAVPASEEENTGGWISVDASLPYAFQRCLIANHEGVDVAQFYDEDEEGPRFMVDAIHDMMEEAHGVTHWMPLPEAPASPSKPGQGAGGSGQDEQGVEAGRQEGAK